MSDLVTLDDMITVAGRATRPDAVLGREDLAIMVEILLTLRKLREAERAKEQADKDYFAILARGHADTDGKLP